MSLSERNYMKRTNDYKRTNWRGRTASRVSIPRVIRKNKIIIYSVIILIALSFIMDVNSIFHVYLDSGMFLIALYIVIRVFWSTIKYIDSINMRSDLNLWLMRLAGGGLSVFGFIFIFSGSTVVVYGNNQIFNYIYTIIGIGFLLLGGFTELRSTRRYGIFVYRG